MITRSKFRKQLAADGGTATTPVNGHSGHPRTDSGSAKSVQLMCSTDLNHTLVIDVPTLEWTGRDLLRAVLERRYDQSIAEDHFNCFYLRSGSRMIQDDWTLRDQGLSDLSTVYLQVRLNAGCAHDSLCG